MAVIRAARLFPLHKSPLSLKKEALVIGGGVSGMTAALSLGNQGFKVHLIEKSAVLGGTMNRVFFSIDGSDSAKF